MWSNEADFGVTQQKTEKGRLRVPSLQEQEPDLAGAHTVRSQTTLPGVGIYEYCGQDVHQAFWGF